MFANGSGDLGSIPGQVIPKTLKMVLNTSLLNTQQYKVYIEDKVEQSREKSSKIIWAMLQANFKIILYTYTHTYICANKKYIYMQIIIYKHIYISMHIIIFLHINMHVYYFLHSFIYQ